MEKKIVIPLIISQDEIKEYLLSGFFQDEIQKYDIEILRFHSNSPYSHEFIISLKGFHKNLIKFLNVYHGFPE